MKAFVRSLFIIIFRVYASLCSIKCWICSPCWKARWDFLQIFFHNAWLSLGSRLPHFYSQCPRGCTHVINLFLKELSSYVILIMLATCDVDDMKRTIMPWNCTLFDCCLSRARVLRVLCHLDRENRVQQCTDDMTTNFDFVQENLFDISVFELDLNLNSLHITLFHHLALFSPHPSNHYHEIFILIEILWTFNEHHRWHELRNFSNQLSWLHNNIPLNLSPLILHLFSHHLSLPPFTNISLYILHLYDLIMITLR